MPVFADAISADPQRPSAGEGFVRAKSAEEAVELIGHPEVNVYPLPPDAAWRGEPDQRVICWTRISTPS